jgi:hypothetical protein
MINFFMKKIKDESGMALTASTMFVFVVLSIMAFYLARFSILNSESAGHYLQNVRARNLVQTGLEIGLQTVSTSYSSLQSSITGKLNKGTYTVLVDNSKDEVNSNLAYNHYSLLKSTTVVGGVHRAGRLIISPYPNAFNLSLFSDNQSNGTFNANSNSSISGDFFFNGTISNVTMGNNSVAYSSSSSSSSPIIFHGLPKPSFPILNHSIYTNILNTVSGQYESSSGGGGEAGSSTQTIWNPNGGHCNVCGSGQRYACSSGYGGWSNNHSFNDFVPTGSMVVSVMVKFKASGPCGGTWNVTPSLNGQSVGSLAWYNSRCSCNVCDQNSVQSSVYNDGFPNYKYGQNNTLSLSHSGKLICIHSIQVTLEYVAGSSPGEAENESISLSSFANNTLMHDGDLSFTSCNIVGPGYILASGDILITGNTSIGGGVKILSEKNISINGTSTIGSSLSDYSILYGKSGISLQGNTTYGLVISAGNSFSSNNSIINGAVFSESSSNSITGSTFNGSLVSKNNLTINSSTITKGSLPDLFGLNLGFKPSVIPGSYLEY